MTVLNKILKTTSVVDIIYKVIKDKEYGAIIAPYSLLKVKRT